MKKIIIVNLDFNKNDDFMRLKISDLKRKKAIILRGGGKDKIKKQHEQGKLTARERIDFLKDPGAISFHLYIQPNPLHDYMKEHFYLLI